VSEPRIEQVKEMIRDAFALYRAELRGCRVMFFGSRVTGNARARSDFDVAVDGPTPLSPKLLDSIRATLDDLPTLYRVDLVDLATVAESTRAEMIAHTETIL